MAHNRHDHRYHQAKYSALDGPGPKHDQLCLRARLDHRNVHLNGIPAIGRSFSETSTQSSSGNLGIGDQIIWSFDFYDTNPAGSPQRNFANLQDTTAPGSTNQLISMGLNNNQSATNSGGNYYMARILGYSPPATDPDGGPGEAGKLGSGAYFKLNDFATSPLRSSGWHNIKTIITTPDGVTTNYQFFVDGTLAEKVSGVGLQLERLPGWRQHRHRIWLHQRRSRCLFRQHEPASHPGARAWIDRFARYRDAAGCPATGQVIVYRLQITLAKRAKLMC